MTEEQIEQALTQASAYQLYTALRRHHGARCLHYWTSADVIEIIEGVTEEQADEWLEDNEEDISEWVGDAFSRYLNYNSDGLEVEETEEQED